MGVRESGHWVNGVTYSVGLGSGDFNGNSDPEIGCEATPDPPRVVGTGAPVVHSRYGSRVHPSGG